MANKLVKSIIHQIRQELDNNSNIVLFDFILHNYSKIRYFPNDEKNSSLENFCIIPSLIEL